MIFPTDSLIHLRGTLEDRVTSGELSEAEAYREALEADPSDPRALRLLALLAEDEDDFATAQDLAWRWLHADPLSHEVFTLIGRLLLRDPSQAARAAAYRHLGREKLHFDPEAPSEPAGHPIPSGQEPAAVTHELEPHRLLHSMWVASTGEIDRELVDRVLARGADLMPLLIGILNLYGEDLLDDVDDALVVRALALLGEVGDPTAVPALARFLPLEDDALRETASWGFQRLAFRKPSEALAQLNQLIPTAGVFDLAATVQQVCTMPAIPGRAETILAIEARLPEFDGAEGNALVLSLITGVYVMEGLASPFAARLASEYGDKLTASTRRELQKLRRELKDEGPYIAAEDEITVYDLCCAGFDPVEEDEPYVRGEPKLGRNDPCWCGSGKKYKKCHMAADESR